MGATWPSQARLTRPSLARPLRPAPLLPACSRLTWGQHGPEAQAGVPRVRVIAGAARRKCWVMGSKQLTVRFPSPPPTLRAHRDFPLLVPSTSRIDAEQVFVVPHPHKHADLHPIRFRLQSFNHSRSRSSTNNAPRRCSRSAPTNPMGSDPYILLVERLEGHPLPPLLQPPLPQPPPQLFHKPPLRPVVGQARRKEPHRLRCRP